MDDNDSAWDGFYSENEDSSKFLDKDGNRNLMGGFVDWLWTHKKHNNKLWIFKATENRSNITHGHSLDYSEYTVVQDKVKIQSKKSISPSDLKRPRVVSGGEFYHYFQSERIFGRIFLSPKKSIHNLNTSRIIAGEAKVVGTKNVMRVDDPRRIAHIKMRNYIFSDGIGLTFKEASGGYSPKSDVKEGYRDVVLKGGIDRTALVAAVKAALNTELVNEEIIVLVYVPSDSQIIKWGRIRIMSFQKKKKGGVFLVITNPKKFYCLGK